MNMWYYSVAMSRAVKKHVTADLMFTGIDDITNILVEMIVITEYILNEWTQMETWNSKTSM